MLRWWMAEAGLFLTVFGTVALSGPGRMDVVDGQTRYEVARSLIDHGDSIIRDSDVWFCVFPGRDGRSYTKYRFPQSAVGVLAIVTADSTGPIKESRRHFFFVLISALACAVIATSYAALFRSMKHQPWEALFWGGCGVFCTPNLFYGTSTFDDILGSAAIVGAVSIALQGRHDYPRRQAILAGLALGFAFNCKEPLGIFVLPVLGAVYDPNLRWRLQWDRLVIVGMLLVIGVGGYMAYDFYKFPPGSTAAHAEMLKLYGPTWAMNPAVALLVMACSLGAGALFYNPSMVICFSGLTIWWRNDKLFVWSLTVAIIIFILFISLLTFFKGDPAWGPRYLTPIFAILWIFAPAGARLLRKWVVMALLGLGLLIQIMAISIDPHRLYIEQSLPSAFYISAPGLYFHPAISHLINRPREIIEVIRSSGTKATCYSPSPTPTFAFPVIDLVEKGPGAVQKYEVLRGFRFWWASFCYLDSGARPINIGGTVVLLLGVAALGLILQAFGVAKPQSYALFTARDVKNR